MGTAMLWWIVENTLLAALLALLVTLVSRAKRVPPVVRHGLWLIVLIKLIVPPVFSLGIPVPGNWNVGQDVWDVDEIGWQDDSADPPAETNSLRIGARPPLAGAGAIDALPENETLQSASFDSFLPVEESQPLPLVESEVTEAPPVDLIDVQASGPRSSRTVARPAVLPISPAFLLFWVGLAGTVLVTLVQCVRLVRLRRLLNRALCAPHEFTTMVIDLAAQLNVRSPAVRISSEIASPFVCAWGPPILVWPASRLAGLRDSACRAVIVHELAHLARRDHWIGWIEIVASFVWWWNPLFWYVRHQLHENAELACDAWVTGLFPEARRAYARALVDLAELDSMNTAIVPVLGVGDGSRKLFERRLVMIMGEHVRYRMGAIGFIGMGLLALVALPGCSAGLAADEPVASELLPGINVDGPGPVAGLPEPSLEPADPFSVPTALPAANQPVPETTPAINLSVTVPGIPVTDSETIDAPREESPTPVELPATRALEPAAATNDERLKRLEDRLESLLTELREMKSGGKHQDSKLDPNLQPGPKQAPAVKQYEYRETVKAALAGPKPTTPQYVTATKTPLTIRYRKAVDGNLEAVTLTRATYKLPPGKAEEIAAFFKASLSDEIEVRVKGDLLIVTANPDDQTPIAGFVRLLQMRGAAPTKPEFRDEIRKSSSSAPKSDSRDKLPAGTSGDDAFEQPKSSESDPALTPKS